MLHNLWLIIGREYLTRVRKKSFIVMTIVTPLLILLFYGFVFYFTINQHVGEKPKLIIVDDRSGFFKDKLVDTRYLKYQYGEVAEDAEQSLLTETGIYAILRIPEANSIDSIGTTRLIANEQVNLSTLNNIKNALREVVMQKKLEQIGISKAIIDNLNHLNIDIETIKYSEDGAEKGNAFTSTTLGTVASLFIYLFILLYGVQVMRGVIEEKSNRIVEVLISTVKPFELMLGKIIGIGLVAITQFAIWLLIVVVLGSTVSSVVYSSLSLPDTMIEDVSNVVELNNNNSEIGSMLDFLKTFNLTSFALLFVFYFISGYLFYAALFAAIGSAVDSETDTQQFMMPVTLPLVFSLVLAQSTVVVNPNGSLSFWLSVIPITSPMVMMVRAPFGVNTWELALSMTMMIAGILFTVWLASRIYRIGILMYGKKASYKEIARWLLAKN